MNKEELLKLGITEEQAASILDMNKKSLEGYVPLSRFNEVNEVKNQYKQDIETRDNQIAELSKIDHEGLQATIEKLQQENEAKVQEFETKMQQQAYDFALKQALSSSKARNIKAVESLLDKESIKLDGETLSGFDEQIKKLQESDSYLFDIETKNQDKPTFTSGEHNSSGSVDPFVQALNVNQ